jgi:hypothetical protein
MLEAAIDSAVNSSPLLSNAQRTKGNIVAEWNGERTKERSIGYQRFRPE